MALRFLKLLNHTASIVFCNLIVYQVINTGTIIQMTEKIDKIFIIKSPKSVNVYYYIAHFIVIHE